jgi:hypothetical protein
MLKKPGRYWLSGALLLAALYFGWGQITKVRGDQHVAFTPASQQCGTDGPLHYCIYRDRRGSNGDVLYHMHGRNLDERIWNDDTYFTAMLQHEWQQGQALPPTVVTLSYGPSWLLTPRGRKADSGLLNDLMARLPVIEARVGRPRRRLLMGDPWAASMC